MEAFFQHVNLDEFVKSEIENKGIVVIDEIDKIIGSTQSNHTKASDEGV